MATRLRTLSDEEQTAVLALARSRTQPARLVQRAQVIDRVRQGERLSRVGAALQLNVNTVTTWVKRFNAEGIAGLAERPRRGRPPTYTAEEIGTVIEVALTNPVDLAQPFGSWTLDRLATYLQEDRGIAIKRSRIGEILQAEGLRWRTQESWFGERVDPDFARTRGRLSPSTPNRR